MINGEVKEWVRDLNIKEKVLRNNSVKSAIESERERAIVMKLRRELL